MSSYSRKRKTEKDGDIEYHIRTPSKRRSSRFAKEPTHSKKRKVIGGEGSVRVPPLNSTQKNSIQPLLQLKNRVTPLLSEEKLKILENDKAILARYSERVKDMENKLQMMMSSHKTDLRELAEAVKEQAKNQAEMTFWATAVVKDVDSVAGDLTEWSHGLSERSERIQQDSEKRLQDISQQLQEQLQNMKQYDKWARCLRNKESARECIDELNKEFGQPSETETNSSDIHALRECLKNESSAMECFVQISKLYPQLKSMTTQAWVNPQTSIPKPHVARPSKDAVAAVIADQKNRKIQGVVKYSGAIERVHPPIIYDSTGTSHTTVSRNMDVSGPPMAPPLAPPLKSNVPVVTFTTEAAQQKMQETLKSSPIASKGIRADLNDAIKQGVKLRKENHALMDSRGALLPIQNRGENTRGNNSGISNKGNLINDLSSKLLHIRNYVAAEPESSDSDSDFDE